MATPLCAVSPGGKTWKVYSDKVDVAAGATTALKAAVSGKRIALLYLFLMTDVSGTLTLKSASTAISGNLLPAARSGFILGELPKNDESVFPVALTTAGEALNLTTVTCTADGVVVYAVEQ